MDYQQEMFVKCIIYFTGNLRVTKIRDLVINGIHSVDSCPVVAMYHNESFRSITRRRHRQLINSLISHDSRVHRHAGDKNHI